MSKEKGNTFFLSQVPLLSMMLLFSMNCIANDEHDTAHHVDNKDTEIKHCLTFQEGLEHNRAKEGDVEMHRYLTHEDPERLKTTRFYSTTYDLNNDGHPEYFHFFVGPPFCNDETCVLRIYDFCSTTGCDSSKHVKVYGYTDEEVDKIEGKAVAKISLPEPDNRTDLETTTNYLCVLHY